MTQARHGTLADLFERCRRSEVDARFVVHLNIETERIEFVPETYESAVAVEHAV